MSCAQHFLSLCCAVVCFRLGDLFVINAPWVFPVIWNIVKGWIDPVTRSKIHIIKGDPSARLLESISAENLPAEMGGSAPNIPEFSLHELLEVLPLKEADQGPDGFDLTLVDIRAGKKFDVSIECEAAGQVVEWYWKQDVSGQPNRQTAQRASRENTPSRENSAAQHLLLSAHSR